MTVADDSRNESGKEDSRIDSQTMGVKLPHLNPELEKRVENQISEYETTEGEGVVPRITMRDYFIEACVGVLLTLYLIVELFVV